MWIKQDLFLERPVGSLFTGTLFCFIVHSKRNLQVAKDCWAGTIKNAGFAKEMKAWAGRT
jgi:hypothetical protein